MRTLLLASMATARCLSLNGAVAPRGAALLARRAYVRAAAAKDDDDDKLGAGGKGGHSVPQGAGAPEISEEEKAVQAAVMEHQRGAARLSQAEDARSLLAYSTGYAIISTHSSQVEGYPNGALVGFAHDERGLPVFCFSAMSSHTKDLAAAERTCSAGAKAALCVTAKGFEGAADGRVTLIGDVKRCSKEEVETLGLRELYKGKHPGAFWADFGDFQYYRMHELKAVNFVGGFARAGSITPEEYMGAEVDPIQAFAAPVMGHMNADHGSSTMAMVQHYIGLPGLDEAQMVSLDRLGFMVQCQRQGQTFKLRLPFPRAAADRKDVKTLIVEMTQASLANPEVQEAMQARVDADAANEAAKAKASA